MDRFEQRQKSLQQDQKYIKFRQWILANGGKIADVEYPVAFGKEASFTGLAAGRDIAAGEHYIEIPTNLSITVQQVNSSELAPFVEKHKEFFKDEQVLLGVYCFSEKLKGEDSFWAPLFAIANDSDLPYLWSQDEVDEF